MCLSVPVAPEVVDIINECQADFTKALRQPQTWDWAGILKRKIAVIRNKLFGIVCPTARKPLHVMAHLEIATHHNTYPSMTVMTEAESPVPAVESPQVPDVIDLVTPAPHPQKAPTPTNDEPESVDKSADAQWSDADVKPRLEWIHPAQAACWHVSGSQHFDVATFV